MRNEFQTTKIVKFIVQLDVNLAMMASSQFLPFISKWNDNQGVFLCGLRMEYTLNTFLSGGRKEKLTHLKSDATFVENFDEIRRATSQSLRKSGNQRMHQYSPSFVIKTTYRVVLVQIKQLKILIWKRECSVRLRHESWQQTMPVDRHGRYKMPGLTRPPFPICLSIDQPIVCLISNRKIKLSEKREFDEDKRTMEDGLWGQKRPLFFAGLKQNFCFGGRFNFCLYAFSASFTSVVVSSIKQIHSKNTSYVAKSISK